MADGDLDYRSYEERAPSAQSPCTRCFLCLSTDCSPICLTISSSSLRPQLEGHFLLEPSRIGSVTCPHGTQPLSAY